MLIVVDFGRKERAGQMFYRRKMRLKPFWLCSGVTERDTLGAVCPMV
jgi:hypothetical protein